MYLGQLKSVSYHYFNINPPLAAEKSGGTTDCVITDLTYNRALFIKRRHCTYSVWLVVSGTLPVLSVPSVDPSPLSPLVSVFRLAPSQAAVSTQTSAPSGGNL